MVLLSRSCWRNGEGSVDPCVSASSSLFPFFPQLAMIQTLAIICCYSGIPISCLVDLILPVTQCGCRRDEKKVPLEYWCVLCSIWIFYLPPFDSNFPLRAPCPLWHEISMSQRPDCLTYYRQVWHKWSDFICLCARVCVWILVHRDTYKLCACEIYYLCDNRNSLDQSWLRSKRSFNKLSGKWKSLLHLCPIISEEQITIFITPTSLPCWL